MTKETARTLLIQIFNTYSNIITVNYKDGVIKEAFEMAIEALRKTENSSEIPNNCEDEQTENPCDGCVCDDGKHLMYCMNCKGIAWKTEPPKVEDEPQTDCNGCKYFGHDELEACGYCRHGDLFEPKDEPQTDCETCKHYNPNHEAIACERCLDGKYSRYEPKTERSSE